jgi:hypothetical protein
VKALLESMNLARWVILVTLVASLVLAITGWRLQRKRSELELHLRTRVPAMSRDLQVLATQYSRMYKDAEREGLFGQKDPQLYIREIAANPNVAVGDVLIDAPAPQSIARGVEDRRYSIKPQSTSRGFTRDRIANFMYLLEKSSSRIRVTRATIEREQTLKEWEVGADSWKWSIEVTSRQKTEGGR